MTTRNKEELIKEALDLQRRLGRYMHNDPPDAWLALNLTIAQLKSLFFIHFEGETNFKRLAAALKVTPPNITGIIDRLVDQGLVSREENENNRRAQILKLTNKGVSLLKELLERNTTYLSNILDTLKIEDLSALVQGLNALANAAEKHI